MKRKGLAVAAAGALVVSGLGTGIASGGGQGDSVTGAIKRTAINHPEEWHFIVSAHNGPNGAHGQYTAQYAKGKQKHGYQGKVTCVRAEGNLATVGITITKVDGPGNDPNVQVGRGEIIRIADGGNPSNGSPPQDAISGGGFVATGPTVCPPPVQPNVPYVSGNVQVNDNG
jgi:hypothetical protein